MKKKHKFLFASILIIFAFYKNLEVYKAPKITTWDNLGYYAYLPQFFIENDLGFSNIENIKQACNTYELGISNYQFLPHENGNFIPKYTFGIAIIEAPAFFLGHAWAKFSNYPADGYSYPYQMSLIIWNTILILVSLWILYKILLKYFSEFISLFLILMLIFGTNYYVYYIYGRALPHLPLFFLYVILLHYTIKFHENYTKKTALIIGLILGLLTLSRPSDMLALLVPVFWNVNSWQQLKDRFSMFFKTHYILTILILFGFFLIIFPQLLYWKIFAGEFFYFSYSDPGEGFEFSNPHIFEFLVGFRKGWFIYTPIMLFAVVGLIIGIVRRLQNSKMFLIFLCLNIFLLSSWSCWWYATSFGQRAMIQSYPIYLFGLGYFLQFIIQKGKIIFSSFVTLCLLLVALNQFQIWQSQNKIIDLSRMTSAYYFSVFGKTQKPENADELLLINRDTFLRDQIDDSIRYFKYNSWTLPADLNDKSINYLIDSENRYGIEIPLLFRDVTFKDHAWLKVSFEYACMDTINKNNLILVTCFANKNEYSYHWQGSEFIDKIGGYIGRYKKFHVYYLTPEPRLPSDKFKAYVWLRDGDGKIKIRNFMVESYIRKD